MHLSSTNPPTEPPTESAAKENVSIACISRSESAYLLHEQPAEAYLTRERPSEMSTRELAQWTLDSGVEKDIPIKRPR